MRVIADKLPLRSLLARPRSEVLRGLDSVGAGVLVAGVLTYGFLALAGRVLGPAGFAPVAALWALVFIVGPGLFLPVQQEVGRLVGARRDDRAGGAAAVRVAVVALVPTAVVVLAALASREDLTRRLLDGQDALFWCLPLALVAAWVSFAARGVLSGLGDYRHLARLVAGEALVRLVLAVVLVLVGARSAPAFGGALAAAPVLATALATRWGAGLRLAPGDPLPWRRAASALGWLTVASLCAQLVANAGPLAVELLAADEQADEAGRFLSALVVARLVLYLFQAVQATLVPNLAGLVAAGRTDRVRRAVLQLTTAAVALTAVTAAAATVAGPLAVRLLFGAAFSVSATTMGILTAASGLYVLAASLAAVAVAAGRHRLPALAWLVAALGFAAATAMVEDLFLRVEVGYLVGSATAASVLLLTILPALSRVGRSAPQPVPGQGSAE